MSDGSSEAVKAEARRWVLRLADSDVGPVEHAAFDAWIKASPDHAPAYQHALDLYYALGDVRSRFQSEPRVQPRRASLHRPAIAAALAAAAAIVLAVLVQQMAAPPWSPPLATRVAEVRDIALPDGSIVTLGARTRIELAFTDASRRVRLSEGEAFFRVAHNADRPFLVETQGAVIRVVGTEFEVKSSPDRVRVTVAQGLVEVIEPPSLPRLLAPERAHRLAAGEQISVSRVAAMAPAETAAPRQPAAWRNGFLVYEDASLAEVVADANRYSPRPIRIADRELGKLRVTASYPADQINQMLSSLDAALPLDIERRANGETRLVPAP